jgi:16S rRNA processing protein RimM
MKRLFAIGKVTKVSGLKGEVRCKPLSRFFDEYIDEKPLFLGFSKSANTKIKLEEIIPSGKHHRYRFSGVNSRQSAQSILGQYVYVGVSEHDEINWISEDLLGFDIITEEGDSIGILKEILWLPSNDVYVIQSEKQEFLVPVIPEIVRDLDWEFEVIVISPMEGLLN